MTCWVLGRYSGWCVEQGNPTMESVIPKLLERVLDRNKRVQLNACSALASLIEETGEKIAVYLDPLLQCLTAAFDIYQARNLDILYDTLGTLAEAVGGALNKPDYILAIMPPLTGKWNSLSDTDTGLFPLFQVNDHIVALSLDSPVVVYACLFSAFLQ
jgi:transportin-1